MSLFKINNEDPSPGTTHRIISQAADCHGIYARTSSRATHTMHST